VAALACLLALAVTNVVADAWTGQLKGGGQVTVDPRTNRTTVNRGGVEVPLWDGVHVLQDGSTITVRSGQVVPNQEILQHRGQPGMPELADRPSAEMWIGAPIVGASPCEKLVGRVCGEDRACSGQEGCVAAEQLLKFEKEERAASASPNRMTLASGQCQEADRDRSFFSSCNR
jgi:hypothetical protein